MVCEYAVPTVGVGSVAGNKVTTGQTSVITVSSTSPLPLAPVAPGVLVEVRRTRTPAMPALAVAGTVKLTVRLELEVPVATAEDSIIAKLEWFQLGDESSQRQWDDVSRLVALHGGALDVAHMRRMAESIGVGGLLERLLSQPGRVGS